MNLCITSLGTLRLWNQKQPKKASTNIWRKAFFKANTSKNTDMTGGLCRVALNDNHPSTSQSSRAGVDSLRLKAMDFRKANEDLTPTSFEATENIHVSNG